MVVSAPAASSSAAMSARPRSAHARAGENPARVGELAAPREKRADAGGLPIARDQMGGGPAPSPAGDDVRARVPGEQPAELRRVACDRGCNDAAIEARRIHSRLE